MKALLTTIFAGALLATSPAWADSWKDESGHGRHGKHEHKHWEKHRKHAEKQWRKEHKHWAKHHQHVEQHVVVHQYYEPAPRAVYQRVVVAPPAPPPGVHVVMPNIYIPF